MHSEFRPNSQNSKVNFDGISYYLASSILITKQSRIFGEIELDFEKFSKIMKDHINRFDFKQLWIEYTFFPQLTIRFGKFLTPYSIYNQYHDAAPAYNTLLLPQSIYGKFINQSGNLQRYYPKISFGFQATGKIYTQDSQLEYFLFIVNGRGNHSTLKDDNDNKGLGLRLIYHIHQNGLKVGYSYYTDKNGSAFNTRQTSMAGDISYNLF